MQLPAYSRTQCFHAFAHAYREAHGDDVLTLRQELSIDQDVSALIHELAARDQHPLLLCENVRGCRVPVASNVFASRTRLARLFGVEPAGLHQAYQQRANRPIPPRVVPHGPVLDRVVEGDAVDLHELPMLRHFETDRGPYVTNALIIAEDRSTGVANLSYHRSMLHSRNELATSLHSRGDLWRMLQQAAGRGEALPVAMVIGTHPMVNLAASARVPYGCDERAIAGGLLGQALDVVATPRHGILVPAHAEFVLEGTIDASARADEGPFGEFTGYSSSRSTNNVLHVDAILQRRDAWLVDIAGGASAEHLNLARLPREAEMTEKLRSRFPAVKALHYPTSGTHFHCYVSLEARRDGEARQVLLALLGWDPYVKTAVAVDADIDITRDEQVLWAMATHFQPHRDLFVVDGLPGSALDPSSSADGTTSRMGIDATRGSQFDGVRARIGEAALARAQSVLARFGREP